MERLIPIEKFERRDESQSQTFEIFNKLADSLNKLENSEIVDRVIKEKGGCQNLANKIKAYSERLTSANKKIEQKSSFVDIAGNLRTCLFGFVERVKKKGPDSSAEKIIRDKFGALKDYFYLLEKYSVFENAELSDEDGFIGLGIKKEKDEKERKKLENLRGDKEGYVEICKKILEKTREEEAEQQLAA